MLTLTDLKQDAKYIVKGKPMFKVVDYTPGDGEWEEKIQIPSSTVLTVVRVNEKSVRVHLKFRDKNKENRTVRLVFSENEGEFLMEAV